MHIRIFTSHFLILVPYLLVGCGSSKTTSEPTFEDSDSDGIADNNDCAPNDNLRWNSLSFSSVDSDTDGYRINSQGDVCTNNSLPDGYFSDVTSDIDADCDDANAQIWRNVQLYRDLDDDGVGSGASKLTCIGNIPDVHFSLTGYDCNDADNMSWRKVVIYADLDGDGVGGGSGTLQCIGNSAGSGYSILGYDPNDNPVDPNSPTITNFDLPKQLLTAIDSDGDDDLP